MGLGRRRTASNASSRSSIDGANGEVDDDTLVVEPEQGNVLMHIISQLRPGADLSRVVLPTFILEPRSMLERITNFMCHPEMLLPIPHIDDPIQRFVSVVKFYLSGWHIRPPGVKKPLNPILGEIYTCYWEFPDKTIGYYISEQTSHHPPKSSYFYLVPDHHIRVDGALKPRSKFLGNSAASMMEGTAMLTLQNRGKDKSKGERYFLTQPNMYARGILFGKMKYELGDHSFVRCPELGLVADIEFKTKGWVGGTYNAIGGTIRNEHTNEALYELSGLWSDEMFIKDLKTGHKEMFFNAHRSKPSAPHVRPLEEQEDRESQKLWAKTAQAVRDRNHELATDEKTKIEDLQREEAARRAQEGVEWHPRLFRRVKSTPGGLEEGLEDLEWIINAKVDGDTPQKQAEQVMAIYPILKGQQATQKNAIPPQTPNESREIKEINEIKQTTPAATPPAPASAPTAAHSAPATAAAAAISPKPEENLIDLGEDKPPTHKPNLIDASHQSTEDIQTMLSATGKPKKDEPLLNFHKDLQQQLPPASVKRTDTQESQDVFEDAQE